MKKYEIMYILKANLDEAARKAEMEKLHGIFTNLGGKILKVDETMFGLRDLAYPIKKETKGYYVVIEIEADTTAINEFNRLTKINNNVLRFNIMNIED